MSLLSQAVCLHRLQNLPERIRPFASCAHALLFLFRSIFISPLYAGICRTLDRTLDARSKLNLLIYYREELTKDQSNLNSPI